MAQTAATFQGFAHTAEAFFLREEGTQQVNVLPSTSNSFIGEQ